MKIDEGVYKETCLDIASSCTPGYKTFHPSTNKRYTRVVIARIPPAKIDFGSRQLLSVDRATQFFVIPAVRELRAS